MVICTTVVWLLGTPERFVGLSALIHGLLLTSLLLEWSQQNYARTDWLSPLVIGLLVLKVLLEMMGAMHSAILLSAGSDYGYIHLAGLAGGIIAWRLHRKRLASLTA
jgi:membrane associated rhomboid family serine protease